MAKRISKHRTQPPASSTQPPAPMSGGLKVAVVLICVISVLLFVLLLYKGRTARAQAQQQIELQTEIEMQREQANRMTEQYSEVIGEQSGLRDRIESGELDPQAVAQDRLGLELDDVSGDVYLDGAPE